MLSGLLVRFLSHRPWLVGTTLTLNNIPEDCDPNGFRSNEHNVCADALSQKKLYLTSTSIGRFGRLLNLNAGLKMQKRAFLPEEQSSSDRHPTKFRPPLALAQIPYPIVPLLFGPIIVVAPAEVLGTLPAQQSGHQVRQCRTLQLESWAIMPAMFENWAMLCIGVLLIVFGSAMTVVPRAGARPLCPPHDFVFGSSWFRCQKQLYFTCTSNRRFGRLQSFLRSARISVAHPRI